MHKLESEVERDTHKALWDFEIQTAHLNVARSLNQVIKEKKKKM